MSRKVQVSQLIIRLTSNNVNVNDVNVLWWHSWTWASEFLRIGANQLNLYLLSTQMEYNQPLRLQRWTNSSHILRGARNWTRTTSMKDNYSNHCTIEKLVTKPLILDCAPHNRSRESRLVPTGLFPHSKGLSPSLPLCSRKKRDPGNEVDPTSQLTSGRALIWATRFSRKNENAICRGKDKTKSLTKNISVFIWMKEFLEDITCGSSLNNGFISFSNWIISSSFCEIK